MLSAYVLIQTEVGKAGQVAQAIRGIDGVQQAEDVAGPYDVIAGVQASGMDELGRLVVACIQAVDGSPHLDLHDDSSVAPPRPGSPSPSFRSASAVSGSMESVLAEKLLGGDRSHVGGLESPLALVDVELDFLPLLQRAIPAGLDGAEVHEDVLA
jgi:hypothetical protein